MSTQERRKFKRRPILDTFSVFATIPKKGPHRLTLLDLSDQGLGLMLDTEGENEGDFPVKNGDVLEVHFYLNQSLYLPIQIKVVRLETKAALRQVGGEIISRKDQAHQAYVSFLTMLDNLEGVAKITS